MQLQTTAGLALDAATVGTMVGRLSSKSLRPLSRDGAAAYRAREA
jgi:hypothetical protein